MADQIKKLSAGHSIEVLDAIMTEVEEARGEYESLDARLDEISGEGYSKAEADALLALKQNALNSAQLDAVNSGIDSAKVEQIETNKNNISTDEAALVELVDSGAKNAFIVGFTSKAATSALPAITNNGDGTATANGVRTSSESGIWLYDMQENVNNTVDTRHTLPVGEYVLAPTGNSKIAIAIYKHDGVNSINIGSASVNPLIFTYSAADKTQYPYLTYRLICGGNADFDNYTFKPMICSKAAWDISHEYQPYRPSYHELYEMVKALQANQ